ncbi:hypothetical protein AB0G05_17020 [Nonomuraea wenchangensis]
MASKSGATPVSPATRTLGRLFSTTSLLGICPSLSIERSLASTWASLISSVSRDIVCW